MFAIIELAGKQYKVQADQTLYVDRLKDHEEGTAFDVSNVLLTGGDQTTVGTPYVDGAVVKAKVLEHLKDDKVIVFKKKRRKGYKKKNGHRQHITKIQIESINA
mgnify:CR=1 FL=1